MMGLSEAVRVLLDMLSNCSAVLPALVSIETVLPIHARASLSTEGGLVRQDEVSFAQRAYDWNILIGKTLQSMVQRKA
jgi:hypothetical protein